MKSKKFLILLVLTIFVFGSFGLGFYYGKFQCRVCPPENIDFSLFWEAYYTLESKFVDKGRIDAKKMLYGAISGMVESLEDPYTVFLNPEESKRFIEDVKGAFEGVGIEIGLRKGQLRVIAPLEGTPAHRAGLRPGDKILEINDKSTADMTIEEAVNLIRGPKGTQVVLTIFRDEWEKTKKIELIREIIEVPSLKWELLVSPGEAGGKDNDVVYIKLYHFTEKAGLDFTKAATEILNSPAKKIILDLRNNPGGYLGVAKEISGWFLDKGQTVLIEDFGENKDKKFYYSQGPSRFLEYPMVVLINQGSASGAEILAGSLRDNRGILLIGEKSFGKGSVQELEKLREGSSLKVTVAKWLTPKGDILTDKGLEPDIKVEMTDEDYEQDRDPQLDRAIEVIKELK